ncbi:phospholipase D-like domain-containing protein [Streptomyces sp. CRN 30]|uniref:phospholipase D-like domain-containing protein n=1 Tax=Streptomyces sp. CRN 30 TaxID=3075613 RepID=UPI002A7FCA67|nr:phospholipase D-like domain-containing protein [Streptomyces sp. CRN 30]
MARVRRRATGRRAVALATVLSAGLQAAAATGSARAVDAPGWTGEPLFNDPLGTREEQLAIRTRLLELTGAALPGSTIRVAVYHLWEATVVGALLAARERGVHVRVLLDESSVSDRPANTAYGRLAAGLGTDPGRRSYVATCPVDKSCLGDPRYGKSIMHNKFWLFSAVRGAGNVVVQTTANSTPSAHTRFFNDALLLPDNPTMYGAYAEYFDTMAAGDWKNWKYRTAGGGPYEAYFFPRAGTTRATDTVYAALDRVTCVYEDGAGAARRTSVRVAIFKITRQAVAGKLVALQRAGCRVSVVYAESDSAASGGGTKGTWEKLHTPGGPAVRCYNDDRDPLHPGRKLVTPYIVHSKYLLIDGVYAGVRNKVVLTGSGNYTGPALRENDEAVIEVDDDALHDRYRAHFQRVTEVAHPGRADGTDLCKGVKPLPADGERAVR